MRFSSIKSWVASLCVLALVACGGGGAGGDPVLGGDGGSAGTAAKIDVQASNTTLGDGDSTVQIAAIVKDSSNVGVANATVQWSFDAGYLVDSTSITDGNGRVTATFAALDRTNAAAKITVKSGTASGSVSVALKADRVVTVDSPAKTAGVAINGATAVVTATVTDLGNVAISGAQVSWSTDAGTLKDIVSVTNAQGLATAVFDAGATLTSPVATITVRSSGFANTVKIPVKAVSKSIEVLADATTIGTGGDQVVIRAVVKNGLTNGALPNEAVVWQTDTGTLTNQVLTTNSSGVATAILSSGANKQNRIATVTVTAGPVSQPISIPIVDTNIKYSGTNSLALDSSVTTNLTFSLADSKGLSIPGQLITFKSSLGNSLIASGPTNASGQVLVAYRPTVAGTDRITAEGAGVTKVVEIIISGNDEKLTFDLVPTTPPVAVGQSKSVVLNYLRAGAPQVGKTINLAATVGILSASSVVTDASGSATFSVRSDFAGVSTITGAVSDSTLRSTTQVSFVATQPNILILQVTRSALPPSTDAANPQVTTVSAKVLDANFNPVPNVTVNFSQEADPSQGVLQLASAVTDSSGVATVPYQSGPTSTASGAVVLKGIVASAPGVGVLGRTNLTVNERALFIVLGTGNTISNYDEQTYLKNWNIYVTDANGVRVPNKLVTVKVLPTQFKKGYLVWSEVASFWVDAIPPLICPSEDSPENPGFFNGAAVWSLGNVKPGNFNFNGFLDSGEDLNNDGLLTPGNVVLLNSSVVTTDANGFATVSLRYSESFVPWIKVRLTATATVEGTESSTFKEFDLPGLASDFSVKTVAPAGAVSPFGVNNTTCNTKF